MQNLTFAATQPPRAEKGPNLVVRTCDSVQSFFRRIITFVKNVIIMGLLIGTIALAIPLVTIAVRPALIPEFKKAISIVVAEVSGLRVSEVEAGRETIVVRMSEYFPVFTEIVFGKTALAIVKDAADGFEGNASVLAKEIVGLSKLITDPALSAANKNLLATLIITESKMYGIDPLLTTAIINTNDALKEKEESEHNRIGLMQLTPEKAEQISKLFKTEWKGKEALSDPIYNLQAALSYLNLLDSVYDGSIGTMLIAFRWQTVAKNIISEEEQEIPEEINAYADQVLANYLNMKEKPAAITEAAAKEKPSES